LQRYGINRERNLNSNNLEKEERDTKANDQVQEKNDISHSNNIDNFLKESSIRDRLRRLPSVQDTRIPNEPRLPRARERNNTITSTNLTNSIDDIFLQELSTGDRPRLSSIQDTRIPNEPRLPRLRERNNTITSTNLTNSIDDIFLQELSTGDRPRILPSVQEMRYNSNNTNQERVNEAINIDATNYLTNSMSFRPYIQETNHNISTRGINLYSNNANQIPIQSTGFRQTLKEIVMVPYIENNRTVSKGSQMYAYFLIILLYLFIY
jgi:hypothetical protein